MHARVSTAAAADRSDIVLVHGLLSSRYFEPTAELLARSHRVYAPDLPGFGSSPLPNRGPDLPGLADALAAFMQVRRLEQVMVVGHSIGTQIVSDLAVRYPGLVGAAVLVAPTFEPGARTIRAQYGRWLRNVRREPLSLNAVLVREVLDFGVVRPVRVLRGALRDHMEDRLARIEAPTLVIRGERDTLATQAWCEEVNALLRNSTLVVIPRAPHTLNFASPGELSATILDFAAAVRPAGPAGERSPAG